ncbi:MAG: hypothetical protein MZU95_10405 [Desulfomicrobium escambiense]|nr:hypothetical protein [Desulfomicrobium escambiense]
MRVLVQFKALRFADETIYLRSGSINVMNGMVGLTFSCRRIALSLGRRVPDPGHGLLVRNESARPGEGEGGVGKNQLLAIG